MAPFELFLYSWIEPISMGLLWKGPLMIGPFSRALQGLAHYGEAYFQKSEAVVNQCRLVLTRTCIWFKTVATSVVVCCQQDTNTLCIRNNTLPRHLHLLPGLRSFWRFLRTSTRSKHLEDLLTSPGFTGDLFGHYTDPWNSETMGSQPSLAYCSTVTGSLKWHSCIRRVSTDE